ncbi:MAG: hypothetical protein HUJ51_00965 [Eggerthellaceae bacterium]|nr:hypothetical protein [Eggerthellaceae bacterium]
METGIKIFKLKTNLIKNIQGLFGTLQAFLKNSNNKISQLYSSFEGQSPSAAVAAQEIKLMNGEIDHSIDKVWGYL